ncbi:MAG: DUF3570 domain-containing protein [Methylovulum sp.]|nr:DUF3570 domain-containing protein [Methylovulum sp.]
MAATKVTSALQALTVAALALPGLLQSTTCLADDDEVDFQYSHYQEGKRSLVKVPNNRNPIEVDSIFGSSKVSLTDRIKFAFAYTQDTWSGATPITTAPLVGNGNHPIQVTSGKNLLTVGASPLINRQIFLDPQLHPLNYKQQIDASPVHILATASPETRKQGDFKLGYEWDEAAVDIGGGISVEKDYESRFGNINTRWDFNQKLTSLNVGLSYTNSDTSAILDHDAEPYITKTAFQNQIEILPYTQVLSGNKQDWSSSLGLTQVLNKNALIETNIGYTRSTGYLENPYKVMTVVFADSATLGSDPSAPNALVGDVRALLEQRPNERNQLTMGARYIQYINPLDAALHLDYRFFHDDWGINAHTFEADWVQPLGQGWTVTPRIRYYSQDAANFYAPYLISNQAFTKTATDSIGREIWVDANNPNNGQQFFRTNNGGFVDDKGNSVDITAVDITPKRVGFDASKLPANFSSDQRLSGYGALSGGVTVSKQFAKGLSLEAGFEYYTHQGALKLGGGGEGAYSDFNYYVANAALKVNLSTLGRAIADHSSHTQHHHEHGTPAPAGVMFSHMLGNEGDMMVGYRYMYSRQAGDMLHGTDPVSDKNIKNNACLDSYLRRCRVAPDYMDMHMHMLNIMYAPTDWLNLMLMPQFMDMGMNQRLLSGVTYDATQDHLHGGHQTGGVGDTGMYALFKLFDKTGHHLHTSLGLSAPTGDVDIKLRRMHGKDAGFIHYGMQLGSGTWDFNPSLTYTGNLARWSWGAQLSGTIRLEDKNASGYALGDIFQSTAWGSYNLTHWLSASVRGVYTAQGQINGAFNLTPGVANGKQVNNVNPGSKSNFSAGPMDYGNSYGGRYWDVGFGVSATIPEGTFQGHRFGVEWLQPVEDDVNGYQLERVGALSASWNLMF